MHYSFGIIVFTCVFLKYPFLFMYLICVAASGLSMACKIFIGVHGLSGCGAGSVVMECGLSALWRECRCWGTGTALGAGVGAPGTGAAGEGAPRGSELLGKRCWEPGTGN